MLTPEDKEKCEGLLTKEECLQALKDMSLNKTPGSDGLPVEFYKVFWGDVSDHLLNALNYAYHKGQLSVSQKRGVIKIIPKKDTEPYHVKDWRPILCFHVTSLFSKTKNYESFCSSSFMRCKIL